MRLSALSVCCLIAALYVVAICSPAMALRGGDGATWTKTTNAGADAQVPGWFINLGITGARAKIPDDQPKILEVAHVFADTPAAGKLRIGDRIVGVNGKPFTAAHKFGYGVGKFGYEGPMMEFGNALEAGQGPKLRGRMTIDVMRGGARMRVTLKLPAKYGQYSPTYPFDCPKTDRILAELYAYLLKRQRSSGLWHGRPHINAFATLALMGSGNRKLMPAVKKAVRQMARSTDSNIRFGGLPCWRYALYGAVLGEYYLLTREKWVLSELQEINEWLFKAQAPTGGWGHSPWKTGGEGNGYGPICIHTMQCKMAWSLMQRCDLTVDAKRYAAAHDFVVKGTNKFGYVWYKDGGSRNSRYADMGRTGAAALAHYLSPSGGKEYRKYAKLAARCIGDHPKTFPDTHGSPILGMAWTALGALVDPPSFRKLMDHNRWSFALAQCPDGTFYYQPNRDNNAQDYSAAPRLSASAATALIFSVRYRKLQMTGAKLSGSEIITATVKAIRAAEKAKRYAKAWQACRKLGEMVYDDSPEQAFYKDADKRLRQTGARLAGELSNRSPKPSLIQLRKFAKEWEGCDGLEPIRQAANTWGEKQLAVLAGSKRPAPEAFGRFLKEWEGYPVAEKARETMSEKGEKEFAGLTAGKKAGKKPSLIKLKVFRRRWSGTPAADKAADMINDIAKSGLQRILKGRLNAYTCAGFLKRWKDYPVHDEAAAKFNEKARAVLDKADTGTDTQRAINLRNFAKLWDPLPVAEEARSRRNDVAASLLSKITALKSRQARRYRLRAFIRTYGDTPAAEEAKTALDEITTDSRR